MTKGVTVTPGFVETQRGAIAALFWQVFEDKLGFILGPKSRALPYIAASLQPSYGFCCTGPEGVLLGAAGIKTRKGGLLAGSHRDLVAVYGRWGAMWRSVLLGAFARNVPPGVLLLDGIFVAEAARGQGIGGRLLSAVVETARSHGFKQVHLDVAIQNAPARALYDRHGFYVSKVRRAGVLWSVAGVKQVATMVYDLGS